jgi:hypothetical protein
MPDPVETAARAPGKGVKALGGKFKGLPPWAYVGAIGVGGAAVWYGISRSRANAAAAAENTTGTTTDGYSLGTSGDLYPGSGAGGVGTYNPDPTTGTTQNPVTGINDILDILERLGRLPTGGGTQPSANPVDHYTPSEITVNIPPQAVPVAPEQPQASAPPPAPRAPDPCVGEYPFLQDHGPRAGQCYKVVLKSGKRYRYYKNGDKVLA